MTRSTTIAIALSIAAMSSACGGPRPLRTRPRVVEVAPIESPASVTEVDPPAETQAAEGEPDATIRTLRATIARRPRTPEAAEALVQIGDLESDRGRVMEAIQAYLSVACPSMTPASAETALEALDASAVTTCSPWVQAPAAVGEVWARLGGLYFDLPDLARAEASFDAALARLPVTSPTRLPALYRLAWTQYRRDHYAAALESFARVIDAVDEGTLRDESLAYLGVIVAETDWDADGREDASVDLARAEVRAFFTRHPTLVSEAMWEAARTLFDSADYARSIAIDEALLQRAHRMDEVRARIAEARRRSGVTP
ncbi:MAG: tetratricopeptide repeat protein [Deltaproteobacteria bacterium]|nr:tetratricopeptide repeat protein [Deltaproteobacteria bacterium]